VGLAGILKADYLNLTDEAETMPDFASQAELDTYISKLESDMREAAKRFEFDTAAKLRDTKELRTKEFLFAGSPDFVVMFLPNESFLAMALEQTPNVTEDALKRKVLVATPGTLIGLLKVIQCGWNEQRIAQNAQRIADAGSRLNGEIAKFIEDFAIMGGAIASVNEAFDSSKRRVERKIARASVELTALGAKNIIPAPKSKRIAARVTAMLRAGGADDEVFDSTDGTQQLAIAASAVETDIE
jgi:DNA anti-recombination protein RmuC